MSHNYSPIIIEVLLYTYYCPQPHPRRAVPAVSNALFQLEKDGLIKNDPHADEDGVYRCTPRGVAHVRQLCALPLPRSQVVWMDAHDNIIKEAP